MWYVTNCSRFSFHKQLVAQGMDAAYARKLLQYGLETTTEGLKHGGITNMMDRLSNPAKIKAFDMSEELKSKFYVHYSKNIWMTLLKVVSLQL